MKIKIILIGLCMLLITGVVNAAAPDIEVTRVVVYEKSKGNCNLIKVNLRNVGDQAIQKPFKVYVYIMDYNKIIKYYEKSIRSNIKPFGGGVTFFQRDVDFPHSSIGWKVRVVADVTHALRPEEQNYANNFKEISFTINSADNCAGKPDLTIGKVYFPDAPCHSGVNKLRVYVRSMNRKKLSTGKINVRVIADGSVYTGELLPRSNGTKWAYHIDFNISLTRSGNIALTATVDYDNRIDEENETNNSKGPLSFNCN